ncbi:hypothetical protein H696_06320, partial [Fonticula alba]
MDSARELRRVRRRLDDPAPGRPATAEPAVDTIDLTEPVTPARRAAAPRAEDPVDLSDASFSPLLPGAGLRPPPSSGRGSGPGSPAPGSPLPEHDDAVAELLAQMDAFDEEMQLLVEGARPSAGGVDVAPAAAAAGSAAPSIGGSAFDAAVWSDEEDPAAGGAGPDAGGGAPPAALALPWSGQPEVLVAYAACLLVEQVNFLVAGLAGQAPEDFDSPFSAVATGQLGLEEALQPGASVRRSRAASRVLEQPAAGARPPPTIPLHLLPCLLLPVARMPAAMRALLPTRFCSCAADDSAPGPGDWARLSEAERVRLLARQVRLDLTPPLRGRAISRVLAGRCLVALAAGSEPGEDGARPAAGRAAPAERLAGPLLAGGAAPPVCILLPVHVWAWVRGVRDAAMAAAAAGAAPGGPAQADALRGLFNRYLRLLLTPQTGPVSASSVQRSFAYLSSGRGLLFFEDEAALARVLRCTAQQV